LVIPKRLPATLRTLYKINKDDMKQITLSVLILLAFGQTSKAQFNYPTTKEIPVVDNYFGTKITDNYRWLENLEDTTVKTWIKAQAVFSNNLIAKISGRDILLKRLKEYQQMGGDIFGKIVQCGNTYYYAKTVKGENLSKLYTRILPNGNETLLFDPESIGKNTQLIDFIVDDNGKNLAMKLSSGGAEICQARILDIKTKNLLADNFGPIWSEFPIQFASNATKIIYTKMKSIDNKSDDVLKNMDVYIHTIGTNATNDNLLFSREKYKELNVLPEQFPAIYSSDDKKYLFLNIGSTKTEALSYYATIDQLHKEKINWKPLIKYEDEITDFYSIGNQLFFLSHKNAPKYKVGVTSLTNPNFDQAKIIVPEGKVVITSIQKTKNYIIYATSNGLTKEKHLIDPKTFATKKLLLPQGVNGASPFNATLNDRLIVYNTNWLSPYSIYEYDVTKNTIVKSKWFDMSGSYPDFSKDFAIKEVEVKSHDGVLVPLSILYPKNIKYDGTAPCYLTGYGAYGMSQQPSFIDAMAILLEQGCSIAFAHVRGGGEKGEEWHRAGMKATKPNTWKDFIACAEYLIKEKYTSSKKLIGEGMSAGGILIGRAITERPDLFAVAIDEVGVTNVLRMETTPNGDNQIPELGSVKVEGDTKALIEMDAQSKVVKGTKYPAVFVRSGMNDARVVPWMPVKFAAVLQNSSSSNKPVLLYVNYDNGHFTSDMDENFKEFADMFSFSFWQVGHPKFKMTE